MSQLMAEPAFWSTEPEIFNGITFNASLFFTGINWSLIPEKKNRQEWKTE